MNDTNYFVLSNTAYNFLKRLVQVILPAFASAYFGLAAIWDLPSAEQVVGTVAVLTTFLGVSLGISAKGYEESGAAYDGKVVVTSQPDGPKLFTLELDKDPDDLQDQSTITFKVQEASAPVDDE